MKRCCETCRFFDKGTLAGSGWCRHPERVEAQSDLVLVRASQLTCRKGWDKDFWEPNARSGRTVDRIPRGGLQLGPVPPASPEDIDAIIKAGRASDEERAAASAAVEEDRVVGAAPSPLTHVPKSLITKHLPPAPEMALEAPGAEEGPNSREKILIAKEEVARKRITNRIRPTVEPLPSPGAPPVPPVSANHDGAEHGDAAPAEPQQPTETASDAVVGDNMDVVDAAQPPVREDGQVVPFEMRPSVADWVGGPLVPSIPPTFDHGHWNLEEEKYPPFLKLIQGVNTRRPSEAPPAEYDDATNAGEPVGDVVVRNNNVTDDRPFELPPPVDISFTPPSRPAREKPRARKQRHYSPFRSRWEDARDRPNRREHAPPPVWVDAPDQAEEPNWTDEPDWTEEPSLPADAVLPALDEREAGIPLMHVEQPTSPEVVLDHPADWADTDVVGHLIPVQDALPPVEFDSGADYDGVEGQTAAGWTVQEEPYEYGYDDVVVSGNSAGPILYDPEIDDYMLAPDVSRMCRTCAAFRPADDGERGWCSNGWAFNNRLLVNAWDVPCQTSFGNWWIPNDDHWSDGLMERLHAPAPLFDQLMAQRTPPRRERQNAKKRWS